ncbi:MAG: hypothetical protein HYX71_05265 [Opitutae bacterium]|nr:hypothetical protein [Opitutae bacterium]
MKRKMTPEELEQFIDRELRALPPRQAPAGFEARFQQALEARRNQAALSPEQLEQLVDRELRALPPRRAPRTLEARVLTALEHRAAVAWYHKSWSHWPAAVKAAFLAFGTGVSGAAIAAFYLISQGAGTGALSAAAGERFAGAAALFHVVRWMAGYASQSFASIPALWLYGGLAFVATMYAAFFGLGATAYRTLYRNN